MTIVHTPCGAVQGRVVRGGNHSLEVRHFGGVPYASARRFGLPQPHATWDGDRDCTQPGAAPVQRSDGLDLVPDMSPAATTEDCLTAEIWAPVGIYHRPVLVWIPGGSFRVGGAGLDTYSGRHLAADGDVVVVGLNYRLGLLGFLNAPGVPSNLGLRDLLAGLAWVRDNIAAFGGDPSRITVMGESAGAGAIIHLMCDPTFAVQGAIVLSGSPTTTQTADVATAVATRVLELAGVDTAAALLDCPADAILDLQSTALGDLMPTAGMMPFHPWVDGDVVPISPVNAIATDAMAPVRLVVCTTAHEMELFRNMVAGIPRHYALAMLTPKAQPLGIDAEGVSRGLTACGDDLVTAVADIDLQMPAWLLARSHARRGLPVWRASFSWESAAHGACHAVDLPFHFGTLDIGSWREFAAAPPGESDLLSSHIRTAWTSFATTGTPTCDAISAWPQFGDTAQVVDLGHHIAVVVDPHETRLRSWL